jgi:hypothetical protein
MSFPLTWKRFIEKAKAAGIKDDDEINYIDISYDWDFEFFFDDIVFSDGTPKARQVEVH